MMEGRVKEYNWRDIMQLIWADCGLPTDNIQRQRGELHYLNEFYQPDHDKDKCIRVTVYDKPFSERTEEHASEESPYK